MSNTDLPKGKDRFFKDLLAKLNPFHVSSPYLLIESMAVLLRSFTDVRQKEVKS
jgi:hypothetical protein